MSMISSVQIIILLATYGLDTGAYSFAYCASWASGETQAIAALRASAGRIQSGASFLLQGLEACFAAMGASAGALPPPRALPCHTSGEGNDCQLSIPQEAICA